MLRKPQNKRRKEGGFTLIEVTISMMVFAITITAITAMQNTSLTATNTSLTMQEAGTLADQFMETLSVDALRWKSTSRLGLKYLGGNTSYQETTAAQVNWNKYTAKPVNYMMRYASHGSTASSGATTGQRTGAGRGARYCIFFTYRWAGLDSGLQAMTNELLELNVVVLTPRNSSPAGLSETITGCNGARKNFADCDPKLLAESTCSTTARRSHFIRLSRASMIRRNRSGF